MPSDIDEIHRVGAISGHQPVWAPPLPPGGQRAPWALTDGAGALAGVLLQQLDDVGLLGGRAAAADHGRALAGQLHELVLVVLEANLAGMRERRVGPGALPHRSSPPASRVRPRPPPGSLRR